MHGEYQEISQPKTLTDVKVVTAPLSGEERLILPEALRTENLRKFWLRYDVKALDADPFRGDVHRTFGGRVSGDGNRTMGRWDRRMSRKGAGDMMMWPWEKKEVELRQQIEQLESAQLKSEKRQSSFHGRGAAFSLATSERDASGERVRDCGARNGGFAIRAEPLRVQS